MNDFVDQWRRVEQICVDALELKAGDRAAFLRAECGDDEGLRRDVERLLAQESAADGFLHGSVAAVAAGVMTPAPQSLTGLRLNALEVGPLIGAGGMGEVYLARDTELKRDVALKVLPVSLAVDAERLARFRREAEVLASLNHPNIASIYGFERGSGVTAIVMELIEGDDLSHRIARGRIPIADALPIARQIAEALEAAHEQGIIHRDLKPANIKVRPDGAVKVLDFGLARILRKPADSQGVSHRSLSCESDNHALIVGTLPYMSPEQMGGGLIDRRTDVWAFGCVLYEMLTGHAAFSGQAVGIRGDPPDWSALPPDTPIQIRRLLVRCLKRDRRQRLCDLGDARLELTTEADVDEPPHFIGRVSEWASVAKRVTETLVIVTAAIGVTVLVMAERPGRDAAPEQRFTINLPESAREFEAPALAPDGARLVYAVGSGRSSRLYARSLDCVDPQPIEGTEGASNPFFSPDGQWIGFFTNAPSGVSLLKKVSIEGGPVTTLCETSAPAGAVWDSNDTIVFAGRRAGVGGTWVGSTLYRIPANGGVANELTTLQSNGFESKDWPEILPGGDTILYSVTNRADYGHGRLVALSLKSGKSHTVIEGAYHARYLRTGHLIYGSAHKLMAIPFDVDRQATVGAPVPVVEGVLGNSIRGSIYFAASDTGMLVYALADPARRRVLTWIDRNGHEQPFDMSAGDYMSPRLSPDGSRIAFAAAGTSTSSSIWTWDVARRQLNRVTFGDEVAVAPVWTPNGHDLLFWSNHDGGTFNVYRHASDGTGQTARVTTSPHPQLALDVLPDGTQLIVQEASEHTGTFLSLVSVASGQGTPLLASTSNYYSGRISPDGRWIAYVSNEVGVQQIHVRSFPDLSRGHWLVSDSEASDPVWSRDGRELFFVSSKRPKALMAVSIPAGGSFSPGHPRKLMDWPYPPASYDVSTDGRHFLSIKDVDGPDSTAVKPAMGLVVVLNWSNQLKRLAPLP